MKWIVSNTLVPILRICLICVCLVTQCAVLALADKKGEKRAIADRDSVFKELSAGLLRLGDRAIYARAELEYCRQAFFSTPPVRRVVTTKEGKPAEVIFLNVPDFVMPGEDFSMAFLLIDNQVIDSASCWTSNRKVRQDLRLEDVDGDGDSDVAFRATGGFGGLHDKRVHMRPGDERKWLYAYAITAHGFQSLFPTTERDLKVLMAYDPGIESVAIHAKGLSDHLREGRMTEFSISVTNKSRKELAIPAGRWFETEIGSANYCQMGPPEGKQVVLKPGESASQVVHLVIAEAEGGDTVWIRWKFVAFRIVAK